MTLAQTILERLKEHLALPWPENVSPRERVVMVVYTPCDERKLRRLIQSGEFANEIKTTGHGWHEYDLATEFSRWLAEHEYRDRYLSRPERLWDDPATCAVWRNTWSAKSPTVTEVPYRANDVLALIGGGGLFGCTAYRH
jgi:hypothetical protein